LEQIQEENKQLEEGKRTNNFIERLLAIAELNGAPAELHKVFDSSKREDRDSNTEVGLIPGKCCLFRVGRNK
jgi:hypothetical protein